MPFTTSNALKRTSGSESKKAAQSRQDQVGYTSFNAKPRKAPAITPMSKDGDRASKGGKR